MTYIDNVKFNIKDIYDTEEFRYFNEEIKTWVFDPPYNIGYKYNNQVNDNLSIVEYKNFIDISCTRMFETKCQDANMFLIIYPEMAGRLLDVIESTGWKFKQWISWVYPSNIGMSNKKCTTASRAIVWFVKGDPNTFMKSLQQPYKNPKDKRIKLQISKGSKGVNFYDWWEINLRKNVSKGFKGYFNQLPFELINRIIQLTTIEGDVVGDIMAGSGSTYEVCKEINRKCWLNDINKNCFEIWSEI